MRLEVEGGCVRVWWAGFTLDTPLCHLAMVGSKIGVLIMRLSPNIKAAHFSLLGSTSRRSGVSFLGCGEPVDALTMGFSTMSGSAGGGSGGEGVRITC